MMQAHSRLRTTAATTAVILESLAAWVKEDLEALRQGKPRTENLEWAAEELRRESRRLLRAMGGGE